MKVQPASVLPPTNPLAHLFCASGCTQGHLHMTNGVSIMYFMGARDRWEGLGKPVVEEEEKNAV